MPFKASSNGEFVTSLDFNANEWRDEKARHKRNEVEYFCPVCKEHLTLATSGNGTPFFKHYPESKCPVTWGGVSPEHRDLQVAIYRACKAAGWEADIEARAPTGAWVADVLAWNGKEKWAFEVQLAPITGETLVERAARYRRSRARSVWFLAKWPALCPYCVHNYTYRVPVLRKGSLDQTPEWVDCEDVHAVWDYLYRYSERRLIEPDNLPYWRHRKAILNQIGTIDAGNIARVSAMVTDTVSRVLSREYPDELDREWRELWAKMEAYRKAERAATNVAWETVRAEQRRLHNLRVRARRPQSPPACEPRTEQCDRLAAAFRNISNGLEQQRSRGLPS